MTVLAQFGNQDARRAAVIFNECSDHIACAGDLRVITSFLGIDARHGFHGGDVATKGGLQRIRDFTDSGLGTRGTHRQFHQVLTALSPFGQGIKRRFDLGIIAFRLKASQLFDLTGANLGIVDLQHRNVVSDRVQILVHADHGLLTGVDARLGLCRRFFDTQLGNTGFNGLGHAAIFLDLGHQGTGLGGQFLRQALDIMRAAPRVDDLGQTGFGLCQNLGVTGNTRREIGRQSQRFIQRVGVQRLGLTTGGGHAFDHGARHVVEHVLRGQRPARRLAVGTKRQRLRILAALFRHGLGPDQATGAHLGHFHEVVHAYGPEEAQARRELVDIHACGLTGTQIFDTVCQRIGQLDVRRRSCFLHVVAGNRDRVELGRFLCRPFKDVGNDPHRGRRWIDIGVAHHELFQNVILNGSGQLGMLDALLFTRHDI